ncbi:hypothetical protein ACSMXN_17180 [Jatrophihabitans sp. DSM 45814]
MRTTAIASTPDTPTPEPTTEIPTPEPTPTPTPPPYPKGYPKVVAVETLPDQVRSWYEMDNTKQAVAIADGVWTPIAPGAPMQDALATGVLDGFCGSIKAYERVYLAGQEASGTCW